MPDLSKPAVGAASLPAPQLGAAAFWKPVHAAPSPLLGHIPFLFWLVETIRPRRTVQLGLGDGVAYLALCQAMEGLVADPLCLAFDGGTAARPAELHALHDEHFAAFSTLVPGGFEPSALPGDAKVDLLVVAREARAEDLAALERELMPRLSASAAILFCADGMERETRAGVMRLLGERLQVVTLDPPGQEVPGMDLVLLGTPESAILSIAAQQPDDPAWRQTRRALQRLGQSIAAGQRVQRLEKELRTAQRALEEARAQHEARIEDIAVLSRAFNEETDAILGATQQTTDKGAALENRVKQLEKQLRNVKARRDQVVASTSWKITAPLRRLMRLLRRR